MHQFTGSKCRKHLNWNKASILVIKLTRTWFIKLTWTWWNISLHLDEYSNKASKHQFTSIPGSKCKQDQISNRASILIKKQTLTWSLTKDMSAPG